MEKDSVFGISASVDVDDIGAALNDIVSKLQRVGVVTSETSAKVTKKN
jgi:hypothetical protein